MYMLRPSTIKSSSTADMVARLAGRGHITWNLDMSVPALFPNSNRLWTYLLYSVVIVVCKVHVQVAP